MGNRRDRQREATRQRLYSASLQVFREHGVAGARIDEIASVAGVSRGTFYFHYPSKEDVLVELMRESQERLVMSLQELPDDAPLEEVLTWVAKRLAAQWESEAGLLAQIGMVALKRTAQNLADLEESHPIQAALVPWFARAAHRGEIAGLIPPELLSQFFLVNLFGAALAWCGNPVIGLEELLRNVVVFFLRATDPARSITGAQALR